MDHYLQQSRADVHSMKNTSGVAKIITEFLQSSSSSLSSFPFYKSQLISLKKTLLEQFNFVLEGHFDVVSSLVLTSNNFLISGSKDKTIQIWNLHERRLESILKGHTDCVNAVAVPHNNKSIISGSSDKTVRVWQFKPPFSHSILKGHNSKVMNVVVTADDLFAYTSCALCIKIWNLETLTQHMSFSNVIGVAYSLVVTDGDFPFNGRWEYDVLIERILLKQLGNVIALMADAAMAMSKNCKLIAVIVHSVINVIDIKAKIILKKLRSHEIDFSAIAFTNNSRYLVAGADDSRVCVWNLCNFEQRFLRGPHSPIRCMQLTSDDQYIVAAFKDKSIKILSFETGACVVEVSLHKDWVSTVALMDNSQYLLTGSRDNTIRKWDLSTYSQVALYDAHTGDVNCIKISKDNRLMATGSMDKTIRLWHLDMDKDETVLEGHFGSINSVLFFRNDKYLVSASRDNTYRVWIIEPVVKRKYLTSS